VGAQRQAKAARANRLTGPAPRIDGVLDDSVWATVRPIDDFVEKIPIEGAEPRFRTEVRILYDDKALYVAARMYRPDPERIPVPVTRRDGVTNAESLVLSFDTYFDRRTAYSFSISSGGVRSDYYHGQNSQSDKQFEYDPIWAAKARVDSLGWTAEMRIPFSQLRLGARDKAWGLDIERLIPDRNTDLYWVMIPKADDSAGWSSFFGQLEGIEKINASRGIEVVPYASGDLTFRGNQPPNDPFNQKFKGRVGADIKAGLGSSLTLDATVNPDFGQVEADPAQVNLTAFEVVFAEKRPFFIEGNEILTGRAASFLGRPTYFYTRRVGARPRGAVAGDFTDIPGQTTILGAAKVTGRLPSGLSVGVLAAVTGRQFGSGYDTATGTTRRVAVEPSAQYGVVRLQQEVGTQQSTVGMVLTNVHRALGTPGGLDTLLASNAVTGGLDWRLRFEHGKYELTGWVGFSDVSGEARSIQRIQRSSAHYFQRPDAGYIRFDSLRSSLSGYTASIRGDKNAGKLTLWGIQVAVKSPGFEINDIGQMARADAIDFNSDFQLRDVRPHRILRQIQLGHAVFGQYDYGGERQFLKFSQTLSMVFRNFWGFSYSTQYSTTAMSNTLTRGGPYMQTPHGLKFTGSLNGNQSKPTTWLLSASYQHDALGGSAVTATGQVTFRPSPRWEGSVAPTFASSTNAQQYLTTIADPSATTFGNRYIFSFIDQRTLSAQFRLNYAFTPNFTLQAYAEPFASNGRYYNIGELAQARTATIRAYGTAVGTSLTSAPGGVYTVQDGPKSFTFTNPDFQVLSFRSNLVARWEWLPGSTFFLIWQQNRANNLQYAQAVRLRSLYDAARSPGDNFIAMKISYWIKVR
jgi:hypothetical protein